MLLSSVQVPWPAVCIEVAKEVTPPSKSSENGTETAKTEFANAVKAIPIAPNTFTSPNILLNDRLIDDPPTVKKEK